MGSAKNIRPVFRLDREGCWGMMLVHDGYEWIVVLVTGDVQWEWIISIDGVFWRLRDGVLRLPVSVHYRPAHRLRLLQGEGRDF